jgi:hypothetical protein
MKTMKLKNTGDILPMKIFKGKSDRPYLVFLTRNHEYHVFTEAEGKAAARDCGATYDPKENTNTNTLWDELWRKYK